MKKGMVITLSVLGGILLISFIVYSWGKNLYNSFVENEQNVIKEWSQVENQYQRRYDLIPNLVATVQGVANFEKETYTAVTEARAKVGQIRLSTEQLANPEAIQQFQQAQDGLSSALSRLLVVSENYPQLKANENFLQLQAQLEGTENRINISRMNYNNSVEVYNTTIKKFPALLIANMTGFKEKQYFKATSNAEEAPRVQF